MKAVFRSLRRAVRATGDTVALVAVIAVVAVLLAAPAIAGQVPNPTSPVPSGVGVPSKYHLASAATTNCHLVAAGSHVLYSVNGINTNAATMYLKFFDKATAPVAGTDTPSGPIFALIQNTPFALNMRDFGIAFANGIGVCATGAIADADTTNATTGASVDLAYK